MTAPAYCFERVTRPQCSNGKLREPCGPPELKRQNWESKETKAVRVPRTEYQKGELHRVPEELQRVSIKYSAKY